MKITVNNSKGKKIGTIEFDLADPRFRAEVEKLDLGSFKLNWTDLSRVALDLAWAKLEKKGLKNFQVRVSSPNPADDMAIFNG